METPAGGVRGRLASLDPCQDPIHDAVIVVLVVGVPATDADGRIPLVRTPVLLAGPTVAEIRE